MSCLKFFNTNLIESAIITPSSENLNFPYSNILDPRTTKVFRSTSNSDSIVFDFGSAKEIDSFFIVGSSITGLGVSSITLELNSADNWVSPAFTQAITLDSEFKLGISSFTQQNYRYARVVMTSAVSYCEISNLFIGKQIDLGRSPSFNWSYKNEDLSTIQENRYGQKFIDEIIKQKKINMSFSLLTKDQMDQIFSIYDSKSKILPFFIEFADDNMISNHNRFSGMVYMASVPTITNNYYGRYSLTLDLEEAT